VFNLDDCREEDWEQLATELEMSQDWSILTQELPKSSKRRAVLEKKNTSARVRSGNGRVGGVTAQTTAHH
jgi:hypothetical protein